MRLVSFLKRDKSGRHNGPRLGWLEGNLVVDLLGAYRWWSMRKLKKPAGRPPLVLGSLLGLLEAGESAMQNLMSIRRYVTPFIIADLQGFVQSGVVTTLAEVSFLPPVIKPGKIICVGKNYPEIEPGDDPLPEVPVLFHKVATSLTGSGAPVYLPPEANYLSYEAELALVVGRRARRLPYHQALDCLAGYTVANDVGAPEIQNRTSQWTSGKMLDSFCPLGPALVTPDEVAEPNNLTLRTWINEQLVQDGSTAEMRFDVADLIVYISSLVTLQPGDLILTGSPRRAGSRADPHLPVRVGDRMAIEIEGLGRLENTVFPEVL